MRIRNLLQRLCIVIVCLFIAETGYAKLESEEPATRPLKSEAKKQPSAEEEELADLLNLLNTKIEVVSKKSETMSEAPAIISTLSYEHIENLAIDNLYQALTFVPGVEIYETFYGYTSVTFRGMLQTHYNNKSLLLLNGHPMYNSVTGSYFLEAIPVNAIKRLEIIRGPGSTLYGTNAYGGVISVKTLTGEDINGIRAYGSYGSFNRVTAGLLAGTKKGDFNFMLGGSLKSDAGYKFEGADEFGAVGSAGYDFAYGSTHFKDEKAYEKDYYNVVGEAAWKKLSLKGFAAYIERDKMGIIPSWPSTGESRYTHWGLDLSYSANIVEQVSLSGKWWYDMAISRELVAKYPPVPDAVAPGRPYILEWDAYKTGLELQLNYDPIEMLSFTGGFFFEYQYTEPYTWSAYNKESHLGMRPDEKTSAYMNEYGTYDIAGYLQGAIKPVDWLNISGGLRLNKNKEFGLFVNPRGGLVFGVYKDMYIKALYGRAFRAPNFFEKYVKTTDVLYGNAELKPEVIDTFDLGFDWTAFKGNFRLNGFFLMSDDLISRSVLESGSPLGNTKPSGYYVNSVGQKIWGIEAEWRHLPLRGLEYFVNFSWKDGRNDAPEGGDASDIEFLAHYLFNFGAAYNIIAKYLKASLSGQVISDRKGNVQMGRGADGKPILEELKYDPYFLLNARVSSEPLEFLKLSITANDIVGMNYRYPEYIRRQAPEGIDGGPGRAFYGTIELKY